MPVDKYVKIGDINTRYWEAGNEGSPVMLVHGLGGSIENWEPNLEPLGRAHHVYALDLKGFGRTDKMPLLHSIMELVQFIGDFIAVMHIGKAALVGNSLGGGLVLGFAIEYPQKVEKLVLVGSAGMGREVITDCKLVSIPLVGEMMTCPSRKLIADTWRKVVADPALVTDELVEKTYLLNTLPDARKAFLATLRAGIGIRGQRLSLLQQLWQGMGDIKAPALVVWGQRDRIIPVAHARIAVQKIPHARLKIFEGCGHMPQLERPDEFNQLVLEFLG